VSEEANTTAAKRTRNAKTKSYGSPSNRPRALTVRLRRRSRRR